MVLAADLFARGFIGLTLLTAAVLKLRGPTRSPSRGGRVLGLIEFALGWALIVVPVLPVRVSVGLMFTGFLAFRVYAAVRSIPCGCAGGRHRPSDLGDVGAGVVLLAVALVPLALRDVEVRPEWAVVCGIAATSLAILLTAPRRQAAETG